MFRKVASVQSLGAVDRPARADVFRIVRRASKAASSYLDDGSRQLSVGAILEKVANDYAISADPSDYLFEAIRANTTNPPNENNDGFHQSELLRFDLRAGMPVYQTYATKPHHVDHKTADPKRAKGVILDVTYNDRAPALSSCPRCATKTAERANRDATGLHCKRCGHLVRDEFVEILVGVDTKKDPIFAQGVRKGQLATGSMGCSCLNTTCNVCRHVAYSEREFCEHIRGANKGTLWLRDRNDWRKVSAHEARNLFAKHKYVWDPTDFCYAEAPGFELRKAFEYCENVIFDEYSRVPQPADPKARQREVLRAASLDTEEPMTTKQQPPPAKTAASFTVVRLDGDPDDTFVAPGTGPTALRAALDDAVAGPSNHIEVCEVQAADEAAALDAACEGGQSKSGSRHVVAWRPLTDEERAELLGGPMDQDADVVIEAPPDEAVIVQPSGNQAPSNMPQGPMTQGPAQAPAVEIDDLQNALDQPLTEANMGMGPGPGQRPGQGRGAARTKVAFPRYAGWAVKATERGNVQVFNEQGLPVLLVPGGAAKSAAAGASLAARVMASVRTAGLVATAKLFRGAFTRSAQVVDGALDDMQGFEDKQLFDSTRDNIDEATDMQDGRAEAPASTRDHADEATDMQSGARKDAPKSTQDGGVRDHDPPGKAPKSTLEGETSDMQTKRKDRPSDALQGEAHDHQMSLTAALRRYDERAKRAWAARESKLKAEHARALEAERKLVREASLVAFQRALRLAAARQVSGLEEAPLRHTAEQLLATARPIGQDATGQPVASYAGMVPELARYVAAELMVYGHGEHLENLMARAASLLDMGDQYLLDAERDAQRFAAALPPVTAAVATVVDSTTQDALAMRQAALQGNLPVALTPPAEGGPRDKRAAIRGALNGTQASLRVGDLSGAVN